MLKAAREAAATPELSAWDTAEQFLLLLIEVPRYEQRLRVWGFECSYAERLADLAGAEALSVQRVGMLSSGERGSHGQRRPFVGLVGTVGWSPGHTHDVVDWSFERFNRGCVQSALAGCGPSCLPKGAVCVGAVFRTAPVPALLARRS